MPTYDKTITGTSGNDVLVGSDGNDYITSTTGGDDIAGGGLGDDYLYFRGNGGELTGGLGNDTLDAGKIGFGQYHFYASTGNDTMIMSLVNKEGWGHTAVHAYGGDGNDSFRFVNVAGAEIDTTSRLDDFNPTRDQLVIEGQVIDLYNTPAGMRVVSYLGQQWLHINNDTSAGNTDPTRGDVLIALNGARQMPGSEEVHFSPFPSNADLLPEVAFIDENYVPYGLYSSREASLNKIISNAESVTGTAGADYVYAYKDPALPVGMATTIAGLGGDDVIEAGSGDDTVNGGDGNDLVSGGLDNDNLVGGAGNDRLLGGSENDRLEGGAGNDRLEGGTGADEAVFSGARSAYTVSTAGGVTTVTDNRTGSPDGTDTVLGVETLRFADQVVDLGGNVGPTVLTGGSGDDVLTGGDGVDEIYGRGGHDTLTGKGGNDQILGEGGDDLLDGGAGNDALIGGAGHDTYVVDSVGDVVTELSGTGTGIDTVRTTLSSYTLAADVENLTYLGTGSFTGVGNAKLNTLTGGAGADTLSGGAAKDTLSGGAGTDVLNGGSGADVLNGGTGADDFVFAAAADSLTGQKDTILGFVRGEDDLVVSAIDANTLLAGNQAFVLDAGGTFGAGEIRQRVSSGSLLVEFNTDSDATIEMTVQLTGVTAPLAATDFEL